MTSQSATSAVPGTYFVHPYALVESHDVGTETRIWAFAHVMSGVRIGERCNICDHVFVETGATLGNNVTVKNGVAIWDGVTIEDNVFLGPNCVFTNDMNPRAYIKKKSNALLKTLVRSNATIGANATLLCGIEIGSYAFVGAGAVVVRSVPDFALVIGNPGRHAGWMCVCGKRLPFAAELQKHTGQLFCPACQQRFAQTPVGQLRLQ